MLNALKRGEFSTRVPEGLTGLKGKVADALNDLAEMNDVFANEITLTAEAIRRGRFRERIARSRRRGGWAAGVNGVNEIADELAGHANRMVAVVGSVAKGDLRQKIELEDGDESLKGDFLRHAKVVNSMVEKLDEFGSEVTRVAREVGVDGKLGAQARVKGVSGTWKDLTDNVNLMANNLTNQVRDIAQVTTAVAQGDLTKKITVEVRGEILELKNTINTMVDQLGSFADEVTRVAREVGTQGVLGGVAEVRGVAGTWRDLTNSVNLMADNLTNQVRSIAEVTNAVAQGDLTKKITVDARGEINDLKSTINTMVDQLRSFADEVTRVAREVGTDGVLGGQAEVRGVSGTWRELTENVNSMANNLTEQVRNIADVATAIAEGDLSRKITVDAKGEIRTLKETINSMVDRLQSFQSEVSRVAQLVGTEGTLGVQAEVRDVSGVWRELTENVNQMATNLTDQVRNIAEVTTAVANGDLSRKITVEVRGEVNQLKQTINQMVDTLNGFASEVTRMAREVGTEGVLGGQAEVRDVAGIWRELTNNVNQMANNLTSQVRNIAEVAQSVSQGDLSRKITVDARGEVLGLKETVNSMVDRLNSFGAEVTRLSREVGVEGKLGGVAEVEGVRGLWKELTDNVNLMATNLTDQVRDIADVTTAVAQGDLTRKITVEAKGEILELKNTINVMVDQLSSFSSEVTRLAREVGLEGKLGGQAEVRGISGTWRELTDNVNLMATNLTDQVRNISQVATAIAQGDLEKTIVVDARGEVLDLKNTVNTMVDRLRQFAGEVTRVAREVGTEGNLGGQARVEGVEGTWRDLTDNVNLMASNLTNQVRDIAKVTTAVAQGDLNQKITVEVRGEILELKNTINVMVDQLSSFADEVTRVARDVGVEGKLGGQADVQGVSGTWRDLTDNVNLMADNLTNQVRDIAQVTTAVAQGDLSKEITVEVRGEMLELKSTINTMVQQLSSFAAQVTKLASDVGNEGILGGQAKVDGVSGIWQDLTENVNSMARNLTEQVRGIATVVTAVAEGDLNQIITLEAKGEVATLADTINGMIKTLSIFADEVTNVARDVGIEGKLGGQADVPGASGTWRDLTDNVNELARNLTNQVRSISDVATAVTKGDYSQSVEVEVRGEMALLRDSVNQMNQSLADSTAINEQQDWLKTNLAAFTRMLQGERDLATVAQKIISELASVIDAQHGAFYLSETVDGEMRLKLVASYAYRKRKTVANEFKLGEGLIGQCALEKQWIDIRSVPDDYIQINSGLGERTPKNILVNPIVYENEVKGVVELASFHEFTEIERNFLEQFFETLGTIIMSIESGQRTEELLKQSQRLTQELQNQQEELQQTNEELEEKAREVSEQNREVERKNSEVESARVELEEKAKQLSLTSKYKSEFLANMSHELRTPLNSLLILSQQLSDNPDKNLTEKQVEHAKTIFASGRDLLSLINEVLDLAKVESGTMAIDVAEMELSILQDRLEQSFGVVAQDKKLDFDLNYGSDLPGTIKSDEKRLMQVLRNLLSNAFKFTDNGGVRLTVDVANEGWRPSVTALNSAEQVISFAVSDTGIGIEKNRLGVIFEAFQQADGGTSRRFGGTGLGLSISREIANMLGGDLVVESEVGVGSTFTLFLPSRFDQSLPAISSSKEIEDAVVVAETPAPTVQSVPAVAKAKPAVADDRQIVDENRTTLLIIEDDEAFAKIVMERARRHDFQVLVATTGQDGLAFAQQYKPDAITLDLQLPDMHGWVILDRLKHDPELRHIPVHVMSVEEDIERGLQFGAIDVVRKPLDEEALSVAVERISNFVDRKVRNLLIVEDDKVQREAIIELIGNSDVISHGVESGEAALQALQEKQFDCMVIDLKLPGMSGFELIQSVRDDDNLAKLPIVIYTGRELSRREETRLRKLTDSIIVKGVNSPERLLDETALFLHRVEANLPESKQKIIRELYLTDPALSGKKVLIVDDDARNIFATTSILERYNMNVLNAESGKDGIEILKNTPDIDVVLMDIMMPEMDGYQAMRKIRKLKAFKTLPIIALTAKAMPEDRSKCIKAGASDYIVKPVDAPQLVSLMRVWLYK